ncbi:hypothetical protein L3Q82_026298, partial [Scortum barcoo]
MNCSHTKTADYYSQMYWYRQLPGESMKLIVYTALGSKDHDFGSFPKEKFAATKPDAESGTFTVKNLQQPGDKGLYFCAILSSVVKQSTAAIPNEQTVLRDQFIEGLKDAALRRELRKIVRDKPESSLLDVRNEALLWEMEDSRFHRPRTVKNSQLKSDISETQCSAIKTDSGQHAILDDVQRAVAHQEKQLAELEDEDLGYADKVQHEIHLTDDVPVTQPYRRIPPTQYSEVREHIVGTSKDHDFGEFNNGKFAATKPNAESGTFTVKNLQPGDKGLYFCAVRSDVMWMPKELDIVLTRSTASPWNEERSVLCPPGPPVVHYDLLGLAGVQNKNMDIIITKGGVLTLSVFLLWST